MGLNAIVGTAVSVLHLIEIDERTGIAPWKTIDCMDTLRIVVSVKLLLLSTISIRNENG